MRKKIETEARSWITRERPKIDRIACPWLIRRFIDPAAEFLFAPTERVFAVAEETGATAYDIPGAEPFSHDGELCSCEHGDALGAEALSKRRQAGRSCSCTRRCHPVWRIG